MTVWTVPASVLRVVDGDTLEVLLDLGWRVTMKAKVRLAGVNSPEIATPEGVAARRWVEQQLVSGDPYVFHPVTVVSHSLDKYGRVLGDVIYPVSGEPAGFPKEYRSLGPALMAADHAVPMR